MTSPAEAAQEAAEEAAEAVERYVAIWAAYGYTVSTQRAHDRLTGVVGPALLPVIADLAARWALADDLYPADTEAILMNTAQQLRMSPERTTEWLRMLIGAPDDDTRIATTSHLTLSSDYLTTNPAWAVLSPERAPLVWAAGLTPAEATDRTDTDLQAIAALRGWRWPTETRPAGPGLPPAAS